MPSDAPACAGVLQTGARRWFCFVLATCVLVGWPAGVLGQGGELTREKLLAWFEAERAKAIDPPPLGNVRLDYEVREHATINAATMAQWKIDVEPYPEHPLRRRIVTEERRIKQGPDVTLGSIWRLRSDAWRHNKHPSVPTPGLALYGDYGQQGGQHWRLFEDSIVLDTPGSPVVQSSGASLEHLIGLFLYGGLQQGRSGQIGEVKFTSDHWTVEAANERGAAWTYEGRWDATHDRGFVRRIELRPAVGQPPRIWEFQDYQFDPVLEHWIAKRVDQIFSDGKHRALTEHVVTAVEPVPADVMRAVLRVPATGREDAVRGMVAAKQEQDVPSGRVRYFDERGHETHSQPITQPTTKATGRFQALGIIAAVAIVGILIYLRVRGMGS